MTGGPTALLKPLTSAIIVSFSDKDSDLQLAGLRGIVSEASHVMDNAKLIPELHEKGLLLFTWGDTKYVNPYLFPLFRSLLT